MMNILISSGSFKDVFTPMQACDMIGSVVESLGLQNVTIDKVPMVDGGEYSAVALQENFNLKNIYVNNIINPYGNNIRSSYLEIREDTAYIDSSSILRLLPEEDIYKNPLKLTSFGLGQMIAKVVSKGYKNIYIGLGGTNTVDCGIGMAQALGVIFYDSKSNEIIPKNGIYLTGDDLVNINRVDISNVNDDYKDIYIETLCDGTASIRDMKTPNNQKIGQYFFDTNKLINDQLELGIKQYGVIVEKTLTQISKLKFLPINKQQYFGIAGGINLSLSFIFNLKPKLGYEFFINKFKVAEKVKKADLVITGEGRFDNSFNGKTPIGICKLAKSHNKLALFLTGSVSDSMQKYFNQYLALDLPQKYKNNGIHAIISCHNYYNDVEIPLNEAIRNKMFESITPVIFKSSIKDYLGQELFKKYNIIKD
ncbi:glycerate kinase [Candidatus Pseudothioglobus sp. Uisw_050_01]|uniref:glycerate kinase n=1 Tax=Candidatus Pseudothioglobus sp. Uisw_050_01 TaxID=3230997 RepID=UPI003A8BE797